MLHSRQNLYSSLRVSYFHAFLEYCRTRLQSNCLLKLIWFIITLLEGPSILMISVYLIPRWLQTLNESHCFHLSCVLLLNGLFLFLCRWTIKVFRCWFLWCKQSRWKACNYWFFRNNSLIINHIFGSNFALLKMIIVVANNGVKFWRCLSHYFAVFKWSLVFIFLINILNIDLIPNRAIIKPYDYICVVSWMTLSHRPISEIWISLLPLVWIFRLGEVQAQTIVNIGFVDT